MRRPILTTLATLILVAAMAAPAMAQDREVVILKLTTQDVEDSVMDQLYKELHSGVEGTDGLTVGSGGEISMSDLTLMAGCDAPTPECIGLLADFVDGDLLLFGEVSRSGDAHSFTLRLFDFAANDFDREIVDQTLTGDAAWLARGVPAVVEHFFFGPTASLTVSVSGSPDAEVRVNGEVVGRGSVEISDVAPGEVVVLVMTPDGQEEMRREILRHDEAGQVSFSFRAPEDDDPIEPVATPRDGPSLVPGFALTGLGVAGVVVGILGQSQLTAAETDAIVLVDGREALFESQLDEAREIQDRMNRAHTMRVVGLSVGAVGLVAGGTMLFMALTGGDSDVQTSSRDGLELDLGATSEGVNAGVRLRF